MDMESFLTYSERDIPHMTYVNNEAEGDDDSGVIPIPLNRGHQNLISIFLHWSAKLLAENDWEPLANDQWREADPGDFRKWRINYGASQLSNTPVNPTLVNPTAPRWPSESDDLAKRELVNFKKGIKRDASVYPILKEQTQWDSWDRSVLAQARAHDIVEVFDLDYSPSSDDEMLLFEQKQIFAYSILNRCVLTDYGKTFVRDHHKDSDAQEVYRKLVAHAKTSTSASLVTDKLVKYLVTANLDSSWRGTTVGFLLLWRDKLRQLEDLIPEEEYYNDKVKLRMLESAVRDVPELKSITQIDMNLKAAGNPPLTYEGYWNVLMSSATLRDEQLKLPANRSKRVVNAHDTTMWYGESDDAWYHEGYLDDVNDYLLVGQGDDPMGSDYSIHKAFRRNDRNPRDRPFIPKELWNQLPLESQMILRGVDPNNPKSDKPPASNNRSTNNKTSSELGRDRKVNFHDHTMLDVHGLYDGSVGLGDGKDEPGLGGVSDQTSGIEDSSALLAHVTNQSRLPAHDIRRVLHAATSKRSPLQGVLKTPASVANQVKDETTVINLNGKVYHLQTNTHHVRYNLSSSEQVVGKISSLVDRGANGGLAGEDVRLLETTLRFADVSGINDHTLGSLSIATVAGVVESNQGPVCLIMHQYAYLGKGKSIHSSIQMEHFGCKVNDKSLKLKGGKQRIDTIDGYSLPLQIRDGLAYLDMRPPTDHELDNLPHVCMTSDVDWNPSSMDSEIDMEEWINNSSDLSSVLDYGDLRFDTQGYYRHRQVSTASTLHHSEEPPECASDIADRIDFQYSVNPHKVNEKDPDFELLRPNFAFAPAAVIKKTFEVTTRYARDVERLPWRKHFKSRFPALNVHRRHEPVATDTVFSDTPAIDNGSTCAQIFVGTESLVTDVYGMKTDKEFVNTLEDNIRTRGAMDKLISDRARAEISNRVLDILRNFVIAAWQSEPYHEHQNPAERRYQTVKQSTNVVLDRNGAPAYTWLLCLLYVCFVLNHLAVEGLNWQTPLYTLTGTTTDISALLRFHFWEPVYYAVDDVLSYNSSPGFPSQTTEGKGRFVGFADSVGDALTYKILTDDTLKIIYRSYVRSALDTTKTNHRLDPIQGESSSTTEPVEILKSPTRGVKGELNRPSMVVISPDDVVNRTYLTMPDEKGQRYRARIVQPIVDKTSDKVEGDEIKFLVRIEGAKKDEIVAYNKVLEYLEEELTDPTERFWNFKEIIAHEGPLDDKHPSYKGSLYNVLVVWEDGSRTFEPLKDFGADAPVVCALYADRNGLLESPGWRRFRHIAKKQKKMIRMVNQAKLASFRHEPVYQFGYKVPRTPRQAIQIDAENGNTRWQDAMTLELNQLNEYDTFKDLGKGARAPTDYKKIQVHFVFAVKHDGRHKARLVAGGHLTDVPIDSVYSGVVSLRTLRMVIFLAELNGLEVYSADVGNAYLEATTREKVYIIGGAGFGELEGHTLVIYKALYGLRSSGLRWHERFADTLRDMGFLPSKADPDVWMRRNGNIYEYIAVYVDDLAIAAKDPKAIVDLLTSKYKYKLKGVGPIEFHLGCDYFRDKDGTLCVGPRKYIDKMLKAYESMFGNLPRPFSSPLASGDHPEVDDTPELSPEDTSKYLSMIGALQWVTTLGRFDVLSAVMTMSRFRAAPRSGHLERLKRIYGYLRRRQDGAIRIRTGQPDYSELPIQDFEWMHTVYGDVRELIPNDVPTPLGAEVVLTTYVDANLYHDLITGRAVTGILHLLNGTTVDWYSKRQGTVETATYGSEFVAARIATDQVIDIRTTLRYLGVPIKEQTYMFGDNQSVVTSSTIPHSLLNKRHNALSYHRVREAIAAKILRFFHIEGRNNPADVVSKHCGYPQMWPLVKPILFWDDGRLDEELMKHEVETISNGGECHDRANNDSPTVITSPVGKKKSTTTARTVIKHVAKQVRAGRFW